MEEEEIAWLKLLGYYLHFSSEDGKFLSFSNVDVPHSPTIQYYISESGAKVCKLIGGNSLKHFFIIQSPEIAFKHPGIERFIEAMRYYDEVISENNLR